jgi:hypothetical protein
MNELLKAAELVIEDWKGHVGTHYEGCWRRHIACFAVLVKDALEGE